MCQEKNHGLLDFVSTEKAISTQGRCEEISAHGTIQPAEEIPGERICGALVAIMGKDL